MLEMDQTLTSRLTALIDATPEAAASVPTPKFQAALTVGRERCEEARASLVVASDASEKDTQENAAAAASHADAIATAVDELSVLGTTTRTKLLNLRAKEAAALGAGERTRRAAFLKDAFDTPPSRIEQLGRTVAKDKLHEALRKLESSSYVAPEDLTPLREAIEAVDTTHAAVIAEKLDDAAIYDTLVKARTRAQRFAVHHRQLLEAVVGLDELPIDVGALVLRKSGGGASGSVEAPVADGAQPDPQAPVEAEMPSA